MWVTPSDLPQLLERIAQAGFDPQAREQVRGRLADMEWRGKVLRGSDMLPPAEVHYLWHAVRLGEWPDSTTLDDYIESIRGIIRDDRSGAFVSRYQGAWQVGIIGHTGKLRGPEGFDWILVEYRVQTGYWVTAYQPQLGLLELQSPRRSDIRWLRQPQDE
jgi:hypothetical protein